MIQKRMLQNPLLLIWDVWGPLSHCFLCSFHSVDLFSLHTGIVPLVTFATCGSGNRLGRLVIHHV